MLKRILCLLLCSVFFGVTVVNADQYPSKTITIVVPFSAGGPTDTVGRLTARAMGESQEPDYH